MEFRKTFQNFNANSNKALNIFSNNSGGTGAGTAYLGAGAQINLNAGRSNVPGVLAT